jgi:type I restriction enzyme S subunit
MKFCDIVNPILEKQNQIIKDNQELIRLRDFLLPLFMNGQMRVK